MMVESLILKGERLDLTHRQVSSVLTGLWVYRGMLERGEMIESNEFFDLSVNGGLHSQQSVCEIDDLIAMISGADEE